jgi:hypothetical protein
LQPDLTQALKLFVDREEFLFLRDVDPTDRFGMLNGQAKVEVSLRKELG